MNVESALLRQAVQWAVQLRSEEASAEDREAFEAWRAADARHAAAYERVQRSLRPLQTLRAGGVSPAMAHAVSRRARTQATRRGAMAFGVFGAFGIGSMLGWRGAQDAGLMADARTGTGQRRTLELAAAGGSVVLDARTSLDPLGARGAKLYDGRVLASVARVEGAPWRLVTPVADVLLDGARAAVEWRAQALRVAALEGAVALGRRDGSAVTVAAGSTVAVTGGGVQTVASNVNDTLWTRGLVKLDDEPLERLVAALQTYRPGVLRVDDRAGALRVSGVFSLDDTEATLRAVARTLPVSVHRRTSYWVTIAAA